MLDNIKDYATDKVMEYAGPAALKKYGGEQFAGIIKNVGPQAQGICAQIGESLLNPENESYLKYGKYAAAIGTIALGEGVFGDHDLLRYGAAALIAWKGDDVAKWAGEKLCNLGGVDKSIHQIEGQDAVQKDRIDNKMTQITDNTTHMLKKEEENNPSASYGAGFVGP